MIISFFVEQLRMELYSTISIYVYIAAFFFAIVGHYFSLVYSVLMRNTASDKTPKKFQWEFFMEENLDRFWLGLFFAFLLCYICFRFSPDILNVELSYPLALAIGYAPDRAFRIATKGIKIQLNNKNGT